MPRIADPDQAHAAALAVVAQRAVLELICQDEHDRAVLYARTLRNRADLYRMLDRKPADAIVELAGTARIGQTRALTQLQDGRRMLELYPLGLELLDAGALLVGTVEMLLLMTRTCAEHVQLELGRRILGQLVGLDAADARRLIEATIGEVEADLDLQAHKDRHAQAQANRGVWVKPVEDGMARIGAEIDELKAQRFALDLDELARAQKVLDDRTGVQRT
ncbi:MAG: 13E12 repeat family protein, partial [Actinomycetota bacterium]|nr:13E12 repeat family protein [Actinomycetota bacterium]